MLEVAVHQIPVIVQADRLSAGRQSLVAARCPVLGSATGRAAECDQPSRAGHAHHVQKGSAPVRVMLEALARDGEVVTAVVMVYVVAEPPPVNTRALNKVIPDVARRRCE